MSKDVECPYCNADIEINQDDGHGCREGETYSQQCGECDKYFVFTTSIHFYYDAEKADCLNGEEHKWESVKNYPNYYPDWVRCATCDEDKRGRLDLDAGRVDVSK